MENRKYNNANFIYGSAAPKREYEPVREPRREEKRHVATREVKMPKIGGFFTAFIAVSVAVTLGACVMYINNIKSVRFYQHFLSHFVKFLFFQEKLFIFQTIKGII